MVVGLDRFQEHFKAFSNCYVLIGGSAAALQMEALGLTFRATKDLDIVLLVESMQADFTARFWEFIQLGQYQHRQQTTGRRCCYRFQKPAVADFPFMLELFSRQPEGLQLPEGATLTPLPVEEEASSLSAILMEPAYYELVQAHCIVMQGLPLLDTAALILLKAIAFRDLSQRQKSGEKVDSRDIRKHKNDIYRLANILDLQKPSPLENSIREDLRIAFVLLKQESVDLKALKIPASSREEILTTLSKYYGVPEA